MSTNFPHPSPRIEKVQGTDEIFEYSINMAILMTWEYDGKSMFLRVVGEHDAVLKNP